jgi:hypothetical protein
MMQATLVSSPTVSKQRTALCFALGCAFEQHRDYGLAFDYFTQGNQLKYATLRYQPEMRESNTAQQIRVCSAEFFERRRGFGTNSPAPILIVGLPRSGSTLLEQILASHPKVEATRELASVVRIVARLHGRRTPDSGEPRYPAILESMRADDVRALGEEYLRHASVYRTGKAYFIDKMPNNCRHVGLIHLMLPNAKIIDIRREPIACCVANFKQLYGIGQEFSYRWSDLGRYYQSYLGLMRHWDRVLPGKVHHVYLEDLIANPEAEIRRLLAYCDLEFDARCLQFHKTRRVIATASAVQVRSPISAIGQQNWRHYEGHLAELRLALGDAVTAYRD